MGKEQPTLATGAQQQIVEGHFAQLSLTPPGVKEASEVTLDYLPPRSDREGGLFFAHDPRAGDLQLRAKGFARP